MCFWLLSTAVTNRRPNSASFSRVLPCIATTLSIASSEDAMPREQISASRSALPSKCT